MATQIVPSAPDESSPPLAPGTLVIFTEAGRRRRHRFGTVERVIRRGEKAGWLEVSVVTHGGGSRRYTLPPERVRARS